MESNRAPAERRGCSNIAVSFGSSGCWRRVAGRTEQSMVPESTTPGQRQEPSARPQVSFLLRCCRHREDQVQSRAEHRKVSRGSLVRLDQGRMASDSSGQDRQGLRTRRASLSLHAGGYGAMLCASELRNEEATTASFAKFRGKTSHSRQCRSYAAPPRRRCDRVV